MSGDLSLLARSVSVGFVISFLMSLSLSRSSNLAKLGMDRFGGVQKFHVRPTSRLGGLAIFLGVSVSVLMGNEVDAWHLVICSIPVFAGGMLEDLTHRVGPNIRLFLALLSAVVSYFWLGIGVLKTDVWAVDQLLRLPCAPLLLTMLVVAGFTNGLNIIDGFHGLASGATLIMLTCFLVMALQVQDIFLVELCALSIACVIGFLMFNWPRGLVFLGDAGAYLLGFWVVELGLLLVIRNDNISPMAPVVIGVFPLIETLFSMYRRKLLRNHPVNHPDALHLHTLVYRRLVYSPSRDPTSELKNRANSRVSLYFWVPGAVFGAFAVFFRANTTVLLVLLLSYFTSYLWLYRRLVRFDSPTWMSIRS